MSYNELSQHLFDFVVQLLPTAEEMAIKEDVRKLLEKLIRSIEPESRLLSFGSTANGFSLRNSDMDMCCLIDSKGPILPASDLVNALGDLLERETKFKVKRLPYARIPIVKLALEPSASLPYGISCDIGFENRLALENTRLLLSYASVDPTRVRTIVLFLKVWTKRRKINSPYCGTLSSYGYVLLVIYFLVHVKNPPVLPNLQQMPPLRPITPEDHHIGEHNIWFFDDIELLKQNWRSSNTETVAELLVDFFRYYSREFQYNTAVASIRAGELSKESKGWAGEGDARDPSRERNRLCIEDPFEKNYNVARTVTKDGLFLIRGEFMRAFRILVSKPDRTHSVLTQLCEERDETPLTPLTETIYPQPIPHFTSISRPALHIVDTSPRSIPVDRLSPPQNFFGTSTPPDDELRTSQEVAVADRPLPEHMAPTRSKWTSPPPPDASPTDLESYNKQLGLGLTLATSSNAREPEPSSLSSRSSEATDDDLRSNPTDSQPPSPPSDAPSPASFFTARRPPPIQVQPGGNASSDSTKDDGAGQTPKPTQASSEQEQTRGRAMERLESGTSFGVSLPRNGDTAVPPTSDQPRRASSGPPSLRGSESSSSSSPPDKAPKNLRSRQQKGPPLTLDTAYFGTTAPTPPVISPASIPGTSRVHATTPYVATAPHIHIILPSILLQSDSIITRVRGHHIILDLLQSIVHSLKQPRSLSTSNLTTKYPQHPRPVQVHLSPGIRIPITLWALRRRNNLQQATLGRQNHAHLHLLSLPLPLQKVRGHNLGRNTQLISQLPSPPRPRRRHRREAKAKTRLQVAPRLVILQERGDCMIPLPHSAYQQPFFHLRLLRAPNRSTLHPHVRGIAPHHPRVPHQDAARLRDQVLEWALRLGYQAQQSRCLSGQSCDGSTIIQTLQFPFFSPVRTSIDQLQPCLFHMLLPNFSLHLTPPS
ncbi:uncharacterized protein EI90DRAFT_2992843, partial [Cantharellus anzutake]|uniref:uncharacterized protein n=1 Tax=Cantharellus anzutake TaxID=1750568 RepID=UPI0019055F72